jgi:hypothetical protein
LAQINDEDLRELEAEAGDLDEELGIGSTYGDRFYEIAQREAETEWEIEERVGEVLDDIEREYFFRALKRSRFLKGLAQKALNVAKTHIPALQAIQGVTQLARGNLKGALGALAKTAISMHPAGAAALQGMRALGFKGEAGEPADRDTWQRFAEFAQEAYEELARRTTLEVDNPAVAANTAHAALQTAMAKTYGGGVDGGNRSRKTVRKITIGPGEVVILRRR